MMPFSSLRMAAFMTALLFALPGCGYFQSSEADLDDEFGEFDSDEKKEKSDGEELAGSSQPTEGELQLKLKVGDRFPLVKRIDQRLTQASGQGVLVNRSLTEMLLSLVVEEIRDGSKRLGVRYHRVRYGHNIAGKRVEYNSDANDGNVPPEALVYAGLKDNGFSFWIGPNNQVVELVGFDEFLQRCVQNVPPQFRDAVTKQLQRTHSDEGLANFVDDGIGLLPYSEDPKHPAVAVKVGSVWELKPHTSDGPIPMNIATRCMLKNLTDKNAEISLIGVISGSSAPVVIQNAGQSMRVQVKGGHCSGSCTVDRQTGLPTQSEVNRYIEMTVQTMDGTEIQQRKEVLTSITSYLDQQPSQQQPLVGATNPAETPQFQQSSNTGQDTAGSRVTPAGGPAPGSFAGDNQRSEKPSSGPGSDEFAKNFFR